ncbi:YceI family protein [Alkalimonas amylolytica]|uniref:YceI-like domain-containing protein n=1 Tax=Alkalimonas amylolytica TaxID=152573 RepID=A0A1H4ASL6_ALKAM|nr:YceI family protein [Alkalimonas amylolytica]SEA38880.1 YceI-like domain-containing protein [Alkalimonas amylolytica]
MKALFSSLALLVSLSTQASWQLDNSQSRLDFVSLKNEVAAEVHQFSQLKGHWQDDGSLSIEIAVAGLQTHIPIRDDRMWQYLFQLDDYPLITATGTVSPDAVADLAVGSSKSLRVPLQLTIVGQSQRVQSEVLVTRLGESTIQVHTQAPVMVNGAQFGLTEGLNRLRDLAGLQSINPMVPVTFTVRFEK